jgi:prepilin-type processing-associated H-X9-DG protein
VRSYAQLHEVFPPGSPSYTQGNGTWASYILPQLEQQNHYDLFDFTVAMNHANNTQAVTMPVAIYVCPSDGRARDAIMSHRCTCCGQGYDRGHVLWYAASMGPTIPDTCAYSTQPYACQGENYGSAVINGKPSFVGIFGRTHFALPPALVRDGMSNTFMIGETLPRHCFHNTAFGGNFPVAGTQIPLNTMEGKEGQPDSWTQTELHTNNPHYKACGFKSVHPGGAMFAMADGSVQFIKETIDYKLYNELGTRDGKEPAQIPH